MLKSLGRWMLGLYVGVGFAETAALASPPPSLAKDRAPAAVATPAVYGIDSKDELGPPHWSTLTYSDDGSKLRQASYGSPVEGHPASPTQAAVPSGSEKGAKVVIVPESVRQEQVVSRTKAGRKADKAAAVALEFLEQGRLSTASAWVVTSRHLYREARIAEPQFLDSLEGRIHEAYRDREAERRTHAGAVSFSKR